MTDKAMAKTKGTITQGSSKHYTEYQRLTATLNTRGEDGFSVRKDRQFLLLK